MKNSHSVVCLMAHFKQSEPSTVLLFAQTESLSGGKQLSNFEIDILLSQS